MPKLREILTENISRFLDESDMFQKDLAEGMGVAPKYVSELMRGSKVFRVEDIEEIAKVLKVDPADLLRDPQREDARLRALEKQAKELLADSQKLREIHENTWKKK